MQEALRESARASREDARECEHLRKMLAQIGLQVHAHEQGGATVLVRQIQLVDPHLSCLTLTFLTLPFPSPILLWKCLSHTSSLAPVVTSLQEAQKALSQDVGGGSVRDCSGRKQCEQQEGKAWMVIRHVAATQVPAPCAVLMSAYVSEYTFVTFSHPRVLNLCVSSSSLALLPPAPSTRQIAGIGGAAVGTRTRNPSSCGRMGVLARPAIAAGIPGLTLDVSCVFANVGVVVYVRMYHRLKESSYIDT